MKNTILKKAIPAVLMGAMSVGGVQGMEIIQPAKASLQTNKVFLGVNKGDFVGFVNPSVFQEFSSERLTYRLPDDLMLNKMINLVSLEEIYKNLYQGGHDLTPDKVCSEMKSEFVRNYQKFSTLKARGAASTYSLPNRMAWSVTSKTDNQLIGIVSYQFIQPLEAQKSAPEGELHDFYKNEITSIPYVNISYAVSPNHQRQGYATEMSLALIGTLFQYSNAEVIVHKSIESNIGSARSAETCCFMQKGVSQGENFRVLRKSSQLRVLEESETPQLTEPSKSEEGLQLENLVFDLIQLNKIEIKIEVKRDETKDMDIESPFSSKEESFLPQNIDDLRNWCANGYPFGKNEKFATGYRTRIYPKECTRHYSFQLFCYGIHNGCLPLVRYVLEYHNNIWSQKDLDWVFTFLFANTSGSSSYSSFTMITYLIKMNFLEIFDYVIKNKDFQDFSFGAVLKNGMGNTPFHTLAKYGSQEMIARFLEEKDLVDLCLNADNIKGEKGLNPLRIAESLDKPLEILNLLREAIALNNSMNIDKNRSI